MLQRRSVASSPRSSREDPPARQPSRPAVPKVAAIYRCLFYLLATLVDVLVFTKRLRLRHTLGFVASSDCVHS